MAIPGFMAVFHGTNQSIIPHAPQAIYAYFTLRLFH